jgi:hypothetical protein
MNPIGLPASLAAEPEADRFEIVAAMVIEALTSNVEIHRLDPGGGGSQLADFAFKSHDGTDLGRLEITTTTRENRGSFTQEVSRRTWHFADLAWSWSVRARDTARVKELHQKIAPLLAQLERDGRTGEWIPGRPGLDPADPAGLPADLARLGVVAACAAHHNMPGEKAWVSVLPDMGHGAFSRHAAAREAQAAVDRTDNQAKLQIPGAVRSELFIWLDAGDGQAALATLMTPPFDRTLGEIPVLDLAPGITDVWVASGLAAWPRPAAALFRCDGHRWHHAVAPVLDYDDDRIEAMLARLAKTR